MRVTCGRNRVLTNIAKMASPRKEIRDFIDKVTITIFSIVSRFLDLSKPFFEAESLPCSPYIFARIVRIKGCLLKIKLENFYLFLQKNSTFVRRITSH